MRGYSGMIDDDIFHMSTRSVANIIQRGGTILKTARSRPITWTVDFAAQHVGFWGARLFSKCDNKQLCNIHFKCLAVSCCSASLQLIESARDEVDERSQGSKEAFIQLMHSVA